MRTARLVGRRPEPGDADAYVRFYGDPRTPEELWPSDLRTPDHARITLEEFIEHWQRWGFGVWTVLLSGGEVIGHAGLQHTTIGDRPEVELLWFIHPDYSPRSQRAEYRSPHACSGRNAPESPHRGGAPLRRGAVAPVSYRP